MPAVKISYNIAIMPKISRLNSGVEGISSVFQLYLLMSSKLAACFLVLCLSILTAGFCYRVKKNAFPTQLKSLVSSLNECLLITNLPGFTTFHLPCPPPTFPSLSLFISSYLSMPALSSCLPYFPRSCLLEIPQRHFLFEVREQR